MTDQIIDEVAWPATCETGRISAANAEAANVIATRQNRAVVTTAIREIATRHGLDHIRSDAWMGRWDFSSAWPNELREQVYEYTKYTEAATEAAAAAAATEAAEASAAAEAAEAQADRLLSLPLRRVMDLADALCGVTGGVGLTAAQMEWTPRQRSGAEPRSIAQAFQDCLDRLACATAEQRRQGDRLQL